jgi:flagella basal body P-ring formation protein FlgA
MMQGKDCTEDRSSRRWQRIILLATCTAAVICMAADAETIRLWPTAVVVDHDIRVGDLCELCGFESSEHKTIQQIVVSSAPAPGASVVVRLAEVRDAITEAGVNRAKVAVLGASRCTVSRPHTVPRDSRPVDAKADSRPAGPPVPTLRQAVVDFFQEQVTAHGGTVQVQFGRTSDSILNLRGTEFAFAVRRRAGQTLGLVHIDVLIRRGGETVQTVPMVVSVGFTRPTVVARRAINAQAAVQPEDIQVVDTTYTQLGQTGISDPGRVIGQRAKRFIARGETIDPRQLEPVPLVFRGQLVEVQTVAGGVRITTSAKALQAGGYGDVIELRSPNGKRETLTAVVVGPRRVEIRRERPSPADGPILLAKGETP